MTEPLHYAVVVDERVQKAVLRATRRFHLTGRQVRISVGIVLVIAAGVAVLGNAPGTAAFVTVVIIPALLYGTARSVRRSVERLYPLGATVTTEFGGGSVLVDGPVLPFSKPYDDLGAPVVRAEIVTFPSRTNLSWAWVVPVQLCPPEARARVAAGSADSPRSPLDPELFPRTFVADDNTASRVAWATFRRARFSWRGLRMLLLVLASVAVLIAITGEWGWTAFVAVIAGAELLGLRSMRAAVSRLLPVGSTTGARITPTGLSVHYPVVAQEWSFSDLADVWWDDDAVVLRDRVQRRCLYALPRGLFADEDLERLRAGIAGAQSAPR